ncbi:hypothetical protein EC973_005620 [Apophysomyces ossiformis]|uniref:Uncharacterized protein n=1 Tax=Apophysomyces ossiformis TaxID=679940 RepID=A0A8H7BRZ8_9FUNG|nr:hypothetical protein EC973_005620 [Apophysomyces ossiformis]
MMKGLKGVLSRRKSWQQKDSPNKPRQRAKPRPLSARFGSPSSKAEYSPTSPQSPQSPQSPKSPSPSTRENPTSPVAKLSTPITPPPSSKSGTNLHATPKDTIVVNKPPRCQRSSGVFERSIDLEIYPRFDDVPVSQQRELFIKKLKLCEILFDFADSNSDLKNKEVKRQTLQELLDYQGINRTGITNDLYPYIIRMFSINVFRPIAPSLKLMYDDPSPDEEEDPVFEVAWPHLQLVYEFFLRFVDSPNFDIRAARNCIDHKFLLQVNTRETLNARDQK